jgi:hypothetical protein
MTNRETKKITWYELHNYHSSELKKKYKINDNQLEQSMRTHMDGANAQERRKFYGDVWDSKNKS